MDSFMDKLAQRFNANEMIKANHGAETAEMERMKKQMQEYDKCMQEMRKLNLQNVESMNQVQAMLTKLEEANKGTEMPEKMAEQIANLSSETFDCVHKENVKVYRNVQAVVKEECDAVKEEVEGINKKVNGKFVVALVLSALGFACSAGTLTFLILQYLHIL